MHALILYTIIAVVTRQIPDLYIGRTCPVCINVLQPESTPFFNLPRSNGERETLCKVIRQPDVPPDRCLDLAMSCPNFNDTRFSSSLTICSTDSSMTDYRMCFSNLSREINETKTHFFYSSQPVCTATGRRMASTLYIDSYDIIIQGTKKYRHNN